MNKDDINWIEQLLPTIFKCSFNDFIAYSYAMKINIQIHTSTTNTWAAMSPGDFLSTGKNMFSSIYS